MYFQNHLPKSLRKWLTPYICEGVISNFDRESTGNSCHDNTLSRKSSFLYPCSEAPSLLPLQLPGTGGFPARGGAESEPPMSLSLKGSDFTTWEEEWPPLPPPPRPLQPFFLSCLTVTVDETVGEDGASSWVTDLRVILRGESSTLSNSSECLLCFVAPFCFLAAGSSVPAADVELVGLRKQEYVTNSHLTISCHHYCWYDVNF